MSRSGTCIETGRACSYAYHWMKCRCTDCRRYKSNQARNRLLRQYNLTPEQYDALLVKQNYVCAICKQPEKYMNGNGRRKIMSLAVDHDHNTGVVRGLLCKMCNQALGHLGDSSDSIREVLRYLEGTK